MSIHTCFNQREINSALNSKVLGWFCSVYYVAR